MLANDCPCGHHNAVDHSFLVYDDDGRWPGPDSETRWFNRPAPFPPGERVTYPGRCPHEQEACLLQTLREHPGKVVIG